jgi:hypothetical protein
LASPSSSSATSEEVPPMSKVMRSGMPIIAADRLRRDDAGRGAGEHRPHRQARRHVEADDAAVGLRQMRHRRAEVSEAAASAR